MLQDSSAANSTAIPFERIEVDILKGESRTPEFLQKNHNGRVPVLETESGMFYLSEGTQFFPTDRWQRGKVMQWLCFEQYSHEPYIATTRFWIKALGKAGVWSKVVDRAKDKFCRPQMYDNHYHSRELRTTWDYKTWCDSFSINLIDTGQVRGLLPEFH